jgi:hypothetical protein
VVIAAGIYCDTVKPGGKGAITTETVDIAIHLHKTLLRRILAVLPRTQQTGAHAHYAMLVFEHEPIKRHPVAFAAEFNQLVIIVMSRCRRHRSNPAFGLDTGKGRKFR